MMALTVTVISHKAILIKYSPDLFIMPFHAARGAHECNHTFLKLNDDLSASASSIRTCDCSLRDARTE